MLVSGKSQGTQVLVGQAYGVAKAGRRVTFLRTQPLDKRRIHNLRAELAKPRAEYKKAKTAGK